MDITWIGHAAFRVRSGNKTLIMDPFPPELGLRIPPPQAQADLVTQSSSDPLHSALGAVSGEPIALDGPGEYEAAGMHLRGLRTTRRTQEGEPQQWNTVFSAQAEGIVFCHLGNPDRLLTNREVDALGSPHVLMAPVGSDTGLSAADVVEIVRNVEPRIVIPMLYAHSGNRHPLRELGPFLHELGVREPEAQPRLTVTRANLPDDTQVVVLQPTGAML